MRLSGSSSRASLCANDTTRSGAARAPILLRTPTTSTKCDSRGARLLHTLLAYQDLIWVLINTLLNHSCPRPPTPPVRLATHSCLDQHRLTRTLNPTAVAVAPKQLPTSTLSIMMRGVHLSRSSLAVVALQNSHRHTSVDLKISLRPSLAPVTPAVPTTPPPPTPPTGDRGPVPPLVNHSPDFSNGLISCKTWLRVLVVQGYI